MGDDRINFRHVSRKGRYYRVADPDWDDPLDGSYSLVNGGRWNAPDTFPVIYLNQTIDLARKYVDQKFAGLPYGVNALREERKPLLVPVSIPKTEYVDIVSNEGCRAAGLPETYPFDSDGSRIPHLTCQPIGLVAWQSDEKGILCRSATEGASLEEEELALFIQIGPLRRAKPILFDDWYA